jgi:hypothetical protein
MSSVRATTVLEEKQKVLHILSVFRGLNIKPYCHVRPALLSKFFF